MLGHPNAQPSTKHILSVCMCTADHHVRGRAAGTRLRLIFLSRYNANYLLSYSLRHICLAQTAKHPKR